MARFKYVDSDPHPECKHSWWKLGSSTICEPPVHHRVCFKCRTFEHWWEPIEEHRDEETGKVLYPGCEERLRWSREWIYPEVWDWDEEMKSRGLKER